MLKLAVITVSTRPTRKGPAISKWFHDYAQTHGKFAAQWVDLAEINLPVFDEPNHPRLRQYEHAHTKRWSAIVDGADAFVFVSPEYNYSTPPSLVNALDYLVHEWQYKPAGLVTYGGLSGGLRGAQMTKLMLTGFKIVPMAEAVTIPFYTKHLDEAENFVSDEHLDKSAHVLLDELHKWAEALKPMRG